MTRAGRAFSASSSARLLLTALALLYPIAIARADAWSSAIWTVPVLAWFPPDVRLPLLGGARRRHRRDARCLAMTLAADRTARRGCASARSRRSSPVRAASARSSATCPACSAAPRSSSCRPRAWLDRRTSSAARTPTKGHRHGRRARPVELDEGADGRRRARSRAGSREPVQRA